jgi:hypothetical protein
MPVKSAKKVPQVTALEGMTPLGLPLEIEEKMPKMNLPNLKTNKTIKKEAPKARPTLKYQLVSFTKLIPNPENHRTEFGNLQPLIYEVVNNVSNIDPIRVFPANENGEYIIDRGHRRYKAIETAIGKQLILKSIMVPCVIDDTLTVEKQLIGQLSSNNGKKYTPLEMYRVIEGLIKLGKIESEICDLIPSVSSKLIRYNVSLVQFNDPWLRDAVQLEVISLSTAMKLSYLEDVKDSKTGIWNELKKRLTEEYQISCKKIAEKEVFLWLDELRNGAENERIVINEIPKEILEGIEAAKRGTIDADTLSWLLEHAGIK